jgi:PTS system galactitol-specific IIC component
MGTIQSIMRGITSLPSAVMVPAAILIISLIAGMKFGKAFRAAITIGAGLVGLNAMINVFGSNIGPAVAAFVQRTGINLSVSDLGVFTLLTTTWGSPIAIWFIPVGLVVNLVMLALRLTKTLDADILNYWTWGITAIVVYTLTNNVVLAMIGFALNEILILLVADWTAPKIQEHFDVSGLSIPHGNAALWPPVGIAVNWVIERIPGLRDVDADPETLADRFGVLGEPVVIGVVLGAALGIIGGQPWQTVLNLAVILAAVMLVFPRMLNILMEGLRPISERLRDFMKERFKRDVYIGLDAAVLVGYPDVLAVGILLVPIVVGLALVLPGNRVLPLADLAIATPFLVSMAMPFLKRGNVVRGLIAGTVIFIIALYTAGDLAPVYTAAGANIGVEVPEGVTWTSIGAGSHWFAWIIYKILQLVGYSV